MDDGVVRYDDSNTARYKWIANDHIAYRYQIVGSLGKGAYGDVVEAFDHKRQKRVAIKIMRNRRKYFQAGEVEKTFLQQLRSCQKPGDEKTVCLLASMLFRNHLCLVLEFAEGGDLYAALKRKKAMAHRDGRGGFSLKEVQHISYELLQTLLLLERQKIIHADIKPENVLCADHIRQKFKLADFGISCLVSQQTEFYIQTRWYRAPEVILGADYGLPIDMWNFGCMIAELYTGIPLFPGENEYEQLMYQMELLGQIPESLCKRSQRFQSFFSAPREPKCTVDQKGTSHLVGTKNIRDLLGEDVDQNFVDFILRCLDLDPDTRMTPEEALAHPFLRC